MKPQRQIKMYSFNRLQISEEIITKENLDDRIITLSDSFLIFAFEKYMNTTFANGQLITEMIKVMLPATEEEANKEWDNGLTFNEHKYFAWFATTGGMKKEEFGKCETIFIREDYVPFAKEFEDLISLGKFIEIEKSEKEICINKDVLSRISLTTSSSYMAGDMPNIIVLPQPQFRLIKDYKTVKKMTREEEEKTIVDYELVDHHFNGNIDVFDGGAIATPSVFEQIQNELNVKYPVEFAIIRGYGIGIKGMITKFDIIAYLDKFYEQDTEYFRKLNEQYQFKDMWNEWQTVTDKTMLLNESMVKLAKYYDAEKGENFSTYKDRLSKVDEKYKDIIKKLYVTKINKADEQIEDYRRTNYQLINALALSKADYFNLIKDEIKSYKKILKPFDKDSDKDEWLINIDNIRLFFKNIVNVETDDSEEFQEEVKSVSQNVVTKCEELLHISEEFIKLKYVKNNLARLIEKRSREIASGKFTVKAKYQYIAVCPISYMNYSMYRNQGKDGLQAGQFYSADCNDGDIRTIARNPLCAYSEVHNVTFVKKEKFVTWLSPCRELIYFNQQSDILALMSSADTDGDACTVIDNDIIKNAVVVPRDGKYFINKDDGQTQLMKLDFDNRFLATHRASGNLIGSISLKAANINSNSQHTPDYYNVAKDEFISYYLIDIEDKEEKNSFVNEKLESGEWITTYHSGDHHREYIKQRFYENEKDIYIVLYNAMVSIDAPKTLYFPSSDDMKIINEKYYKKASFLQYRENRDNVVFDQYKYTFGLLDDFTKIIERELLSKIQDVKKEFDNRANIIQEKLVNGNYTIENYSACSEEIEKIYQSYTKERQAVNNESMSKMRKLKKDSKEIEERYGWDKFREEHYQANISDINSEKWEKYKGIDVKFFPLADEILEKYEITAIANAIGTLKNCTEDFIINLFYPIFQYLNDKLQNKRFVYKKDENGDISFLGERYVKVSAGFVDNSNIIKKQQIDEKKRLKLINVKADIRAKVLTDDAIAVIESELKNNKFILFDVQFKDQNVILIKDDKELLEVFNDWLQINEYNLMKCTSVKVELLVDVAKTKKSLKLTVTEITL